MKQGTERSCSNFFWFSLEPCWKPESEPEFDPEPELTESSAGAEQKHPECWHATHYSEIYGVIRALFSPKCSPGSVLTTNMPCQSFLREKTALFVPAPVNRWKMEGSGDSRTRTQEPSTSPQTPSVAIPGPNSIPRTTSQDLSPSFRPRDEFKSHPVLVKTRLFPLVALVQLVLVVSE